jgi:thymidylate kinase
MEIVLITGLDGSGKSTLLKRFWEYPAFKSYEIILLPHIDTENLYRDEMLYNTAVFINSLSHDANKLKLPQLKAIALFASMLLYKVILKYKSKPATKVVFCERHPLIDTGVYARFYAEKLGPGSVSKNILKILEDKYSGELAYLVNLIPSALIKIEEGNLLSIINFIYKWFHIEKRNRREDLQMIFDIDLPDKIYFLKADPKLLFNRIKDRPDREAHESIEVLSRLDKEYDTLLSEINKTNRNKIEIIDANIPANLDALFESILKYYSWS